jgi:FAD/FMN-containing dehydrogenase
MSVAGPLIAPPTVSPATHAAAAADLVRRYRAVPAGTPVRLGKPSSNLFRFGGPSAQRLDTSHLTGVIGVDEAARTAEVQGMTTYEDLVDATLPHGLMPTVVPQLKTITLGGAVTGLGIESTSFRYGLPHESVREMDVLTADGEVITASPDGPHADLYRGFANSYGTLGYALRLVIDLLPVRPYVRLEHRRVASADLTAVISEVCADESVDFVDGTVFEPGEQYLTIGRLTDDPGPGTSDYTGQQIFYRSIRERTVDHLTIHDYLWRWDTDWFWCSGAFGVQHPVVRRLWPRRWRRSDVYHRLVALDRRFGVADRLDRRAGRPMRERVIQDVEVPVERLAEFLDWFDGAVGMRPVWLCPVVSTGRWPTYPLDPGRTYVNVGFWGTVHVGPDAPDGPRNRAIEQRVHELGGHKSLYSEAFYDRATFDRLYDGAHLAAVKARHDPDDRLTSLYDKVVKRR